MEFTDPHVAEQLLAEMEEKEQQLALAAEFGTTLLARTEELQSGERRTDASACPCARVPVCLSACLPACPSVCLSAYLPVCLPVCLSAYLPACLPVRLSACPPVGLSLPLSV
jgi:hypothetical protein